jgi:U2-associated protein SR140
MAWTFRQTLQARLGIVFDHLAAIYHSFPGRITANIFKKQITAVLDLWEDWIVFPPEFTSEMRARLEGVPKENTQAESEKSAEDGPTAENEGNTSDSVKFASKFKTSTFQPAALVPAAAPDAEEDGEPMDIGDSDEEESSGQAEAATKSADDDLDGEPVGDDVDGEPLDEDVDGVPITENVDGEPLDDDLDGAPIDDDVDGVPI